MGLANFLVAQVISNWNQIVIDLKNWAEGLIELNVSGLFQSDPQQEEWGITSTSPSLRRLR